MPNQYLARDYSIMLGVLYAIARPSVSPSHWWISQQRLKLGLCNFHPKVAPSI